MSDMQSPSSAASSDLWTTRRLLEWMSSYLSEREVEDARLTSELLVAHVLGCERLRLFMEVDRPASKEELAPLRAMVKRVGAHEPVQYVLGEGWFYGRRFEVNRSTLIPRSCTETLVEHAIWHVRKSPGSAGVPPVKESSGTCVPPEMKKSGTGVPPVMPEAGSMPASGMRTGTTDHLHIRRRNLPHWEAGGHTYFITFNLCTGELSNTERAIVGQSLAHWHGQRLYLHIGVVMPDHVHVLIQPLPKGEGLWWSVAEILHSIKSFTSHEIQRGRGASGALWQDKSQDRIVRDEEEFLEKWNYIAENPLRAGLCARLEEYPFVVRPATAEAAIEAAPAVTGGTPVPLTPVPLTPVPLTPVPLTPVPLTPVTLSFPSILDIGTGTGCIAITLAKEIPSARILATDVNDDILALAQRNAARHEVADRIDFRRGSLFDSIGRDHRFDIICSNPPYIPDHEWPDVPRNVKDFEPESALRGGADGLDIIRPLIAQSIGFLNPGGLLAVEIASVQSDEVLRLAKAAGFASAEVVKDHEQKWRVLLARR